MRELQAEPTRVIHMRVPESHHTLLKKESEKVGITLCQATAQIVSQWAEKKSKKKVRVRKKA